MKQSTYNQLMNIKEDEQQESPSEEEKKQAPQEGETTPTSQKENKTEQPKQPNIPQEDPIKKEEKIKENLKMGILKINTSDLMMIMISILQNLKFTTFQEITKGKQLRDRFVL